MKKILFYLPAILCIIFYGAVAFIGLAFSPIAIVWAALFCVSGFILNKKQFWGALAGMLPAVHILYMGTQETGQVMNETPVGVAVFLFYALCGYLVFRKAQNS